MPNRGNGSEAVDLVVVGAGGHGAEVATYLGALERSDQQVRFLGFVDDNKPPGPFGSAVSLGGVEALLAMLVKRSTPLHYLVAIGHNATRRRLAGRLAALADHLVPWTLRDPRALVGPDVYIGAGTCLAPASIVTTRVRIGAHCILNVKASVSHDSHVGDYVNLNPGSTVCGNCEIGEGAYIGAGATVIDKVRVGRWTVVGAGAVVTRDLPDFVTAVGVPARVIRHHEGLEGT